MLPRGTAVVASERGLVARVPDGAARLLVPADVTWCAVDTRARAIWYTTDESVYAFDLGAG
jgi:hypothetical protein